MIKLMNTAKLPLNIVKGSYEQRINLAKAFNEKFYLCLTKEFKTKDVMPDVFEKHLKDITGNKITFKIFDSTDEPFVANVFLGVNPKNHNEADRFNIYLPLNRFDKSISLNDTSTFMHELFHFFCEITNPKHSQRVILKYDKNLPQRTERFYHKYLYDKNTNLKVLQKKTLPKFLKKFSDDEKIDILQSCRYRLTEEMLAYQEGAKYYDKIQDDHRDLIYEKFTCDNGESYQFQEKIDILKTFLKDVLAQARSKNKI